MNFNDSDRESLQKIFESEEYKGLTQKPIDFNTINNLSQEKLEDLCKFLIESKKIPKIEVNNKEEIIKKIEEYTKQSLNPIIENNSNFLFLGTIFSSKLEGIIIQTREEEHKITLDEKSKVYLEDKTLIGSITQVFGPVKSPLYLVKKPSSLSIEIGSKVYYIPHESEFIDVQEMEQEILEKLNRDLSDPDASDDPDEDEDELLRIKVEKRKINEDLDVNDIEEEEEVKPPLKKVTVAEEENLLDELFSIPKPLE